MSFRRTRTAVLALALLTSAPLVAAAGPTSAEPPALAWVNPSRCLPACTADPSELRRLDDRGQASAKGKHRLTPEAAEAVAALIDAARAAGFKLRINSAFRSYKEQARVFRSTKEKGRAARPGHSEHQLGTAVDLRLPSSAALAWLAEQAPRWGYTSSYPPGRQRLTGYRPEPWHVRFVGADVAQELARRHLTLEELFRREPARGLSGDCQDCPAGSSRAPCGKTTTDGRCQGTLLIWCYEGSLATVDCASSQQLCASTDAVADCQPVP